MRELIKTRLREGIMKTYLGHKIPVSKIFLNDNLHANGYNQEMMKVIDVWEDDKTFQQNPIEWVEVTRIVPTQKFVSKDNIEDVKGIGIGDSTGAYLVEYEEMYYIIDGHHRIANQIIEGVDKIKAYVHHVNKKI